MENDILKKEFEERVKQHYINIWVLSGLGKEEEYEENKFFKESRNIFEAMAEVLEEESAGKKPSGLIKDKYGHLLKAYVPENKQEELLYIIDKYPEFSYSDGYGRRTVRYPDELNITGIILHNIFRSYSNLSLFADSVADYYKNSEKHSKYTDLCRAYNGPAMYQLEDVIAAELDIGHTDLEEVLEDIIMSENNTNIVTVNIIRGIIKSNNKHLHKILSDLLLAARLQEGVRQAICENMDCGTTEAFLTLLQVITDNDLIRYSSVMRAVCTWTGMLHSDRVTKKQLELMVRALKDEKERKEMLKSNDSIELYIGLWAQGFFNVDDSVESCKKIIMDGTRNQRLVVSYYNRALQRVKFTMKVATVMIENYPQDVELCAAFMPTYMPDVDSVAAQALRGKNDYYYMGSGEEKYLYTPVSCERFFDNEEQARRHYELLKELYSVLPKGEKVFEPCIFPWYSVSIGRGNVATFMIMIAYMLQDDKIIDEVCPLITELGAYRRRLFLRLLLHGPKTDIQRKTLIGAIADKISDTGKEAFAMIKELELSKADYDLLVPMLKYKSADIRKNVLTLLEGQEDMHLSESIRTLLSDKKEEMRLGGLDLLMRLKKDDGRKELYKTCLTFIDEIKTATDKESVIIKELTGASQAENVLNEKGYGLYNPDAPVNVPEFKADTEFIKGLFGMKKEKLYGIIDRFEEFYTANSMLEYRDFTGEEQLLGNAFERVRINKNVSELEEYPFPELWQQFYEENIGDFVTLLNLEVFTSAGISTGYIRNSEGLKKISLLAEEIYGKDYVDADISSYRHGRIIMKIINLLYQRYKKIPENREIMLKAAYSLFSIVLSRPKEEGIYTEGVYQGINGLQKRNQYVIKNMWFGRFLHAIAEWTSHEEFNDMFIASYAVNEFYGENVLELTALDYIKACERKLISTDNIYQGIFDKTGLAGSLELLGRVVCYPERRNGRGLLKYIHTDGEFAENRIFAVAEDIYWKIVDKILKVELKRGEAETRFSYVVGRISKIRGIDKLIDILMALGKDVLSRQVSYYYCGRDKNSCLCKLLQVSEPLPGEDGAALKKALKGKKIPDKRLIEIAMYNTNWIDGVEEYLGWPGLKSGMYYFIAHMNVNFSERTKAVIARYSPLSDEELNNGAFDLNWFFECNQMLGEERFKIIYDSAKYISDGNAHTRARKYADAALGKVTAEELETQIAEKRNKDLLMSYPLIPVKNEEDILRRYQFLQQFLKESKQFGAQRRASEGMAVSMGLNNLAVSTGYSDVTRLTLNMETKLTESMKQYFEWQQAGEVQIKIQTDAAGKPETVCEKDGKKLKSVPAALKKNELVTEFKDVCSRLKNQYTRTKEMSEQFMEDGVEFTASEMENLQNNPVIRPLLENLVYISGNSTGFLKGRVLTDFAGNVSELAKEDKLKFAHPYDLWSLGVWQEYQKLLFEKGIRQPFKQIFRELYVKTEEELEKENSLRYADNQIQPQKTAACLKKRRWVADYENGLQKVYYKENIVARIYALADWFSPSDIEAPVLEWVEFSDRKTFEPLKIKDIPERIFSEVMRDVDLAVSVAHAGGVDPETSHSTIEMRKAIVEFNLPLFKLTNVTFTEKHAVIEGKRASYTVHLGSGVIFKQGGTQIAVLPVHSQHRGKLFLPFIDEDPKTAEIMSKIVMFAEDNKIKDPYILEQIQR